jgi:hypothetical protein
MHIAWWTCLDVLPACIFLALYQSSPGVAHFQAVKRLTGFLLLYPDLPLAFHQHRDSAILEALPQCGVSALNMFIKRIPADLLQG